MDEEYLVSNGRTESEAEPTIIHQEPSNRNTMLKDQVKAMHHFKGTICSNLATEIDVEYIEEEAIAQDETPEPFRGDKIVREQLSYTKPSLLEKSKSNKMSDGEPDGSKLGLEKLKIRKERTTIEITDAEAACTSVKVVDGDVD